MSQHIESPDPKPSKGRRTSGAVRQDHLSRGAFLIEFAKPTAPMDMFGGLTPAPGLGAGPLFSDREYQSVTDQYRTMERRGFRVTKDTGCLIADEQYATYQAGATVKAHQRAFAFFAKWRPKSDSNLRNRLGWPSGLQISHLCHRRGCGRIDHLIAEPQWRNLKRNYCGINGTCDCGNEVACIRTYQMEGQIDEPEFCGTTEEVKAALEGAPPHTIHGNDRHANREAKSAKRKANKEARKRKTESHAHATKRKQQRLSGGVASE